MKLKRTWPAICIWVLFVIFNIFMVASYSFYSGLFKQNTRLVASIILTILSILSMSGIMIGLGRLRERIDDTLIVEKQSFKIIYYVLFTLIILGGIIYRANVLAHTTGDIIGKYSLYENSMVGVTPSREVDLLSILYSGFLRPILFFTGNIISVPFYFQIACFTIFIILGTITVKMLLGKAAALVFAVYISFMPVFTTAFTGLELSTDSLFTLLFGIELFIVALYIKGIVDNRYKSVYWIVWFVAVGIVIGFMTYVDAGTVIMILPFLLASVVVCGTGVRTGVLRLVFVIVPGILVFFILLAQEAGLMNIGSRLEHWVSYFFNNLNTFSTFWTYTDFKVLYLFTVIIMSGVIVGFWKNRNFERISPWLFSMLLMFASVPFMGPTRMNTQSFVTIYYAFVIACVASLIVMKKDETAASLVSLSGEYEAENAYEDYDEDEEEPVEEYPEDAKEEYVEETEAGPAKEAEKEPDEEAEEEAETVQESAKEAEEKTVEETAEESEEEAEAAQEPAKEAEEEPDEESEEEAEPVQEAVKATRKEVVEETVEEAEEEAEAAQEPAKTTKEQIVKETAKESEKTEAVQKAEKAAKKEAVKETGKESVKETQAVAAKAVKEKTAETIEQETKTQIVEEIEEEASENYKEVAIEETKDRAVKETAKETIKDFAEKIESVKTSEEEETLQYVAEQYDGPLSADNSLFRNDEEDDRPETFVEEYDEYQVTYYESPESPEDLEQAIKQLDALSRLPERIAKKPEEEKKRYVPEGMVLPEDDEDVDLTPRMKMPELKSRIKVDGTVEKLKVKATTEKKEKPAKRDFDIPLKAGDDFDI